MWQFRRIKEAERKVIMAENLTNQKDSKGVIEVPLSQIRRNPNQPRKHFDQSSLEDLASSIAEIGQLTPVELRPLPDGSKHGYELTDGERRWRACQLAEVPSIKALVTPVEDDEEQFVRSVVANFGREDHTPLETARAIQSMLNSKRLNKHRKRDERLAMIARVCAQSLTWVKNHLSILDLHPGIIALMESDPEASKRIGSSLAAFLNTIEDRELQLEIAREVSEKGLNLTQVRSLTRRMTTRSGNGSLGQTDKSRMLSRFLKLMEKQADDVLSMPESSYRQVLSRKTDSQQLELLGTIDRSIEFLTELREKLSDMNEAGDSSN
jgi:ParB family chromosome partitioning protein